MTYALRIWLSGLMLGLSLLVVACGNDDAEEDEELPDVECTDSKPAYDEVAAFEKCTMCHSSKLSGDDRKDAPTDVNFDTESAAEAHAEKAAEEVFEGEMPPMGSGITLTSAEKQELYEWALCSE
jgi:uncharacterized membrane protein